MDFSSSPVHTDKFKTTFSHSHDKDTSLPKSTYLSHSSALKLGAKKLSQKTIKTKDEAPGSEYDIMRVALRSSEPDYFADMEPAVSFTAKNNKTTLTRSHSAELSSKLVMVEDTSQASLNVSFVSPYNTERKLRSCLRKDKKAGVGGVFGAVTPS